MKPMNDMDYVEIYAKKFKEDNNLFKQHKKFIESQLKASKSLFKKMFGKNFKINARKYLLSRGLLSKQLFLKTNHN